MQPNIHPEDQGTASMNLGVQLSPSAAEQARLRLRPSVARGITGRMCGIADLFLLSITLVYFALWAGGVELKGNLMTLLSIRMSVGHFVMLALCWMVWRRIFIYCGGASYPYLARFSVCSSSVLAKTCPPSPVAKK